MEVLALFDMMQFNILCKYRIPKGHKNKFKFYMTTCIKNVCSSKIRYMEVNTKSHRIKLI